MSWINDAKLSTKLITAFALCAFITLGVGLLGSRGVSELSGSLRSVFNNNLVGVMNIAQTKIKAVGQTRDMYRLYVATAAGLPQATLTKPILRFPTAKPNTGWLPRLLRRKRGCESTANILMLAIFPTTLTMPRFAPPPTPGERSLRTLLNRWWG